MSDIGSVVCTSCFGHGRVPRYDFTWSRYVNELEPCYRCGGSGRVPDPQPPTTTKEDQAP